MLSLEKSTPGSRLHDRIRQGDVTPFIGVYDVFSASIAARRFEALFVSGYSFAASQYGLPDIGFITWSDIVTFVQRLRLVVPRHHLLVDIDDGYGDPEIACHVVRQLDSLGASAVVLEDQRRPRRCGHMDGKQLLPLEDYLPKLRAILKARTQLLVVARTDATDPDEICERTRAFAEAGADIVLADGIRSLGLLNRIAATTGRPLAFNQLAGGKSPNCSLQELRTRGVALAIYSTPCLFAVQAAVENTLTRLVEASGDLGSMGGENATLASCNAILQENLTWTHR